MRIKSRSCIVLRTKRHKINLTNRACFCFYCGAKPLKKKIFKTRCRAKYFKYRTHNRSWENQ